MAKQVINIGILPNDKSGDPIRTAFNKVNENFNELYTTTASYTPTTSGDWAGVAPTTLRAAIDRLAAAVKILGAGAGA